VSEILKLKVSPKGQITLPKKIRAALAIEDYVYLEIKENKAELKPVSFVEEMKELLIKDLQREGYSDKELQKEIDEKLPKMLETLKNELNKKSEEETVSYKEALEELGLN